MTRLKKILKILAYLLLALLAVGAAFFVHVWYFKPFDVNLFFARTALQFALESPEMLSTIRVLEPMGLDFHSDDLDDASIAAGDRMFKRLHKAREVLHSYDDAALSDADRRSKEIALSFLDLVPEAERFRFHTYPVNQMLGPHSRFPTFMKDTHQVHDRGDAEDYVARLSKVGVKFDQVLEGLRHREQLGILPPQFLVDHVVEEMSGLVATPVEESILLTSLEDKMAEAGIDEGTRQSLAAAARSEIETTVYPAYQRLIDYFSALDAKVEGNHGVWHLPDGDQLYRLALRIFTTSDLDPETIHQLGKGEVARIQGEILAQLEQAGRDVGDGFAAAMLALKEDPAFYYPDTDEGRQAILRDYQSILDEISDGLDAAFDVRPVAGVEVRREAEFREKTAPAAHYQPPAMDGSRPGVFYANLRDIQATPKFAMRTLAYHEGIPGHHFQIALQMEQEGLPFFRRLMPFTAFIEGWALYAERLAWELGFVADPFDNVGRLRDELFRAVRLVVDTGIHHRRWSREQAIDYMLENTGMPESEVVSEIERYFVMPGQACAYKIGMMKILELREKAKAELGERFDLRQFHRLLLTNGSVPLPLMERLVDEMIESGKG